MGILIALLIFLFVPVSVLLFAGGVAAIVVGEILEILLFPVLCIVLLVVTLWGRSIIYRIKSFFVRRIEKKTLSDRFEQLKTPGNALSLGGLPWKVVAVEDGEALVICMKAGKIHFMKVNRPKYPINFILETEHRFLQMANQEITDRLLERPDTFPKLQTKDQPEGRKYTGYFFLLTEEEVVRYFGGMQQAAEFLKESNEPYYVDQCSGHIMPKGAKYLMFANADGKCGFYHAAMRINI
jgi:hypothetical protein